MRPGRRGAFLAVVCLTSLAAGAARAQVITGSLLGSVSDESGAVLPGATVTLTSPVLVGGPLVRTTNEKGQYRHPLLPPGIYTVRVEKKGFAVSREEAIPVSVGGTVERNVALKLAPIAETVDVTGSLVDSQRTGVSTTLTPESLEKTPISRSDFFELAKAAPGVSATRPTDRYTNEASAFGSGVDENSYVLDGANFTGSAFYGPAAAPAIGAVQEIEVIDPAISAEYGNAPGAVFNVITRQGGDHWRLDASYYTMPPGLNSQPITLDCGCPEGKTGFEREEFYDVNSYLGGPLLKDRLWLFGGYERVRDAFTRPGGDPRFPGESESGNFSVKLTWQISPRLRLMQAFHQNHWSAPDPPTPEAPYETGVTYEGDGRSATLADLSFQATNETLLELRVSGFLSPDSHARPHDASQPYRYDLATGVASGGSYSVGTSSTNRFAAKAKVSHLADDFLAGRHDFRFGVQYEKGSEEYLYGYPGGALYYDYAGAPYNGWFREPFGAAGETRGLGLFAEDLVRLGERLSLRLGIRFDHTSVTSTDLSGGELEGAGAGGPAEGLGTLYTWDGFSPRLGLNLKLTADGRTVARAEWAHLHPGAFVIGALDTHAGLTPFTLAYFDPATGEYSDVVSVTNPIEDNGIDPGLQVPSTDQLSIGFDRELPARIVAGLTYVRKRGRDFTGWQDIGGVYGEDTTTLQDGRVLPTFPLLNSPDDRFYLLTNPPGRFLEYDGLLLTLQKRWSNRWQALVSYSYSEARGLVASSGAGPFGGQVTDGARREFGRDPNDLTSAEGRLLNDRTHLLRAQGAWEVPKIGVLVAGHFQYVTGKPWAGSANVRLPQGPRAILVEPPGTQRLESQTLLDLRVSKTLRFGKGVRAELLLDVLNVLNEAAGEAVVSRNVFSPNFAEPSRFIEPRRAMLGVRLSIEAKR